MIEILERVMKIHEAQAPSITGETRSKHHTKRREEIVIIIVIFVIITITGSLRL